MVKNEWWMICEIFSKLHLKQLQIFIEKVSLFLKQLEVIELFALVYY